MKTKQFEVYMHTSPSGNSYVGYTKNGMEFRWNQHLRNAKTEKLHFSNAINKYPENQWIHEQLFETNNQEKAKLVEIFFIGYYDTFKNGYNMTLGGDGGNAWRMTKTPEELKEIDKKKANFGEDNGFYGKKHSEENLKKAVAKRHANGTYEGKYVNGTTITYKDITYYSKQSCMKENNLTRRQFENLLKKDVIIIINEAGSNIRGKVSVNAIPVTYKGIIYSSMSRCKKENNMTKTTFKNLLDNKEVKYARRL